MYQHNTNQDAKLILDKVYFQDGETFVVFSLEGIHEPEENHSNDLSPCRSKIIELISKAQDTKDFYNKLLNERYICDLPYVSMSIEEFTFEKEEYDRRKEVALTFIQELKEAGEKDQKYLNFMFRQVVNNGIIETNYSEEDYC